MNGDALAAGEVGGDDAAPLTPANVPEQRPDADAPEARAEEVPRCGGLFSHIRTSAGGSQRSRSPGEVLGR